MYAEEFFTLYYRVTYIKVSSTLQVKILDTWGLMYVANLKALCYNRVKLILFEPDKLTGKADF